MPPRWHALIKLDPYYNFVDNQKSEDKVCEGECDGGDPVTNGGGKASGLWGATMCGSLQLQLPAHTHLHAWGGVLMYQTAI